MSVTTWSHHRADPLARAHKVNSSAANAQRQQLAPIDVRFSNSIRSFLSPSTSSPTSVSAPVFPVSKMTEGSKSRRFEYRTRRKKNFQPCEKVSEYLAQYGQSLDSHRFEAVPVDARFAADGARVGRSREEAFELRWEHLPGIGPEDRTMQPCDMPFLRIPELCREVRDLRQEVRLLR